MQSGMKSNLLKNISFLSFLPYAVFFTVVFFFFSFFADYILFYQEKSSLFIFSIDFLSENLRQPGGVLIWLGKLFTSLYFVPAAGALLLSLLLTVILLAVSRISVLISGKNSVIIMVITGLILFYLHTDYRFMIFNSLGLCLQLLFFMSLIRYKNVLRGFIPVLFAPVLYFATGAFVIVYLILVTSFFVLEKDKTRIYKIFLLWILILITFYISEEYIFFQTINTLLFFPFTEINPGSAPILFFVLTGVLSLIPLLSKINFRIPERMRLSADIETILLTLLFASGIILTGVNRFDRKDNNYFEAEKLFYQGKFNELIAFNTANPTSNILTIYLNNIALCETGNLNNQLFSHPQDRDGKTLFLKWEMNNEVLKRGGYFYYTIGIINEAHRWAYENMVIKGYSPEGIKMLIKTEIINRNYNVAAKYISLLKKTLFYSKEAEKYEKFLFNDAAVEANPELGKKRKTKLKSDFFTITDNPSVNIDWILANDSLNRNAFEYKLAIMLIRKNYEGILNILPQFERYGYKKLPFNAEEAVVSYATLNKKRLSLPENIQVDNGTIVKWNRFVSLFQRYKNDRGAAEPAMRKEFGNTFWYYAIYR
jgi:hypothetical protein